ncbi:hypothetical protein [Streptomyces sp. NPDC018693]|uniref:hypothetical protein n=1 Tax=unclassified Streptomyces TaxID=2593676 RepID=UPI0037AE82CF
MKKSVIVVLIAVVLAAGGGIVYASGAYDELRDGQALDEACHGLVDASEVRKALGADRVSGKSTGSAGCRVYDPGDTNASLLISVQRGRDDAESIKLNAGRILRYTPAEILVPVGHGWPALVSAGSGTDSYATAFLPCGEAAEDDLVLSLSATRAAPADSVQERRDGMAVLVTRALKQAAKKQECEFRDTGAVRNTPTGAFQKAKEAGTATGTCQGIDEPDFVYEAEADNAAPIEQCLLFDGSATPAFRIAAYYGPYSNAARHNPERNPYDYVGASGTNDGKSWVTASCSTGAALYILEPLTSHAAAGDSERQALHVFAAQSAKRHSCDNLSTPINKG